MLEHLVSVGLDVGTTTTQLILSKLTVENRASAFSVPEMTISSRDVFYRSQVHFTPLAGYNLVDAEGVRAIVEEEYRKAGIGKNQVDTGAVIITGETSRKENARAVLDAVSGFAGDFVVATAGPDLESVLAAKGAGAVAYSQKTGKTVLHMDIGGGTSNLALIRDGKILRTGCLNVGGRLIKHHQGVITYVSPVLENLISLRSGDPADPQQLLQVAQLLTRALEMVAGLRPKEQLFKALWTEESGEVWQENPQQQVISFSGGVADCIEKELPFGQFGDMGTLLGRSIKNSLLCKGDYILGSQTIRATVIGAGCHSTQLSGSTVFCTDLQLPVKNLPVAVFTRQEQDSPAFSATIRQRLKEKDSETVVIALPGYEKCSYQQLSMLAGAIARASAGKTVVVCLEADIAKALGQKLFLLLPPGTPCLCIDRVRLEENSYLDVGLPVGPALPVVVKTLILSQ